MKQYPRETWIHPGLTLRSSPIHGRGHFAGHLLRTCEVVFVFGGTLFSAADIRSGKANNRTLMQVGEDSWLGNRADEPLGRDYYINHSCDPNLWMTDEVTLVARRDITSGEEVTMDYAMHFADPQWKMKNSCHCGSSHCRRVVTGSDWMLEDLQKRYLGCFSPLLNERIAGLSNLRTAKKNG